MPRNPGPPPYDPTVVHAAIAASDRDAFQLFYNYTKPYVHGLILKKLKSADLAEEIMQVVYVNLWDARKRLPLVKDIIPYIRVVALHSISNYLGNANRRQLVEQERAQSTPLVENPDEAAGLASLVESRREQLRAVVRSLPPQQQLVFRLCKYENMEQYQVARQLNIAPLTVKRHLSEAVKKINARIRKQT